MSIVVLCGAGASYAVNSTKYPTTVGFEALLPEDIRTNQLYRHIVGIASAQQDLPIDIEKVLWRLNEIQRHVAPLLDSNSTIYRAFKGNPLHQIVGETDAMCQAAGNFRHHIRTLESNIFRQIYDVYLQEASAHELEQTWLPLMRGLMANQGRLDIFTTNYDLVLESVAAQLRDEKTTRQVHCGYTDGVQRRVNVTSWDQTVTGGLLGVSALGQPSLPKADVLVTKLHGSIDWSWGSDSEIVVGGAFYKGEHSRHAIVYPRFKEFRLPEPFEKFHQYLRQSLQHATALVVVGFAFRDERIAFEIADALPHSAAVVVIDPAEELSLPPNISLDRLWHIRKGFDAESVAEALSVLKR